MDPTLFECLFHYYNKIELIERLRLLNKQCNERYKQIVNRYYKTLITIGDDGRISESNFSCSKEYPKRTIIKEAYEDYICKSTHIAYPYTPPNQDKLCINYIFKERYNFYKSTDPWTYKKVEICMTIGKVGLCKMIIYSNIPYKHIVYMTKVFNNKETILIDTYNLSKSHYTNTSLTICRSAFIDNTGITIKGIYDYNDTKIQINRLSFTSDLDPYVEYDMYI
jgi:hypothetical protein